MKQFSRGQLVIGKGSTHTIVKSNILAIVRECYRWSGTMRVEIVGGKKYYRDNWYVVNKEEFELITLEEYLMAHPNSVIDYSKLNMDQPKNGKITLHMDKSKIYEFKEGERERLVEEVCEWFEKNNKPYKKEAIETMIDEWVINNGWIIRLFMNHPNYNGKYQIVFSEDYYRKIDLKGIREFRSWLSSNAWDIILKNNTAKVTAFSYPEALQKVRRLTIIQDEMISLRNLCSSKITVGGKTLSDIREDLRYFIRICDIYKSKQTAGELVLTNKEAYKKEAYDVYEKITELESCLDILQRQKLSKADVALLTGIFGDKKFNIVEDKKLSRTINEILSYYGVADDPGYNKKFAIYSDAVNPIAIKRYTVLSVHPIDFITMSNGNSWSSCHSVLNNGMYCSGTFSYMLDPSSFVFYTVDKSYKGNQLELQPKITRCMFHMGEDKVVQGRVYPQSTDGDESVYLQIRNIARRVLSQAMEVNDDWIINKGTKACYDAVITKGTHYDDYLRIKSCNVSILKRPDKYRSSKKIVVGATPICVKCGKKHKSRGIYCCR